MKKRLLKALFAGIIAFCFMTACFNVVFTGNIAMSDKLWNPLLINWRWLGFPVDFLPLSSGVSVCLPQWVFPRSSIS